MREKKKYFVTAIGTDIGKTITSAVLVNALKADYWKPVQCGNLDDSDSIFISKNTDAKIFDERFRLKMPASPHQAATVENISISLNDFTIPETKNHLIVEGAGGMMVPLNTKNDLVIDIAVKFNLELIIVASFYLGSINHTLLTLEYAKRNNLKVAMLIFSGEVNESSLSVIKDFYPEIKLGFIPKMEMINKKIICEISDEFSKKYGHELE